MKKYFATLAMVMLAAAGFAQSEKLEPEFIGQVVVVNADSTTTLLQKEPTKIDEIRYDSSSWYWTT